jgi:glycosyltransferase involved in cell wall biosynthesis
MHQFYEVLDCFVIPSYWESFGLTAIEAMSTGIPVIASNVNGLNEVVTDLTTGLFISPNDINSLVEKLSLIYNNPSLRDILIKNSLIAVKKFSTTAYIERIISVIYDKE